MFILCLIVRWHQLFISVLMQLPADWCWHVPNRPDETGGLGVPGTQLSPGDGNWCTWALAFPGFTGSELEA